MRYERLRLVHQERIRKRLVQQGQVFRQGGVIAAWCRAEDHLGPQILIPAVVIHVRVDPPVVSVDDVGVQIDEEV